MQYRDPNCPARPSPRARQNQRVQQIRQLRTVLLVCAVIIAVLAVAVTVFAVRSHRMSDTDVVQEKAYASLSAAFASEQAAREQEGASYQAQLDEQSKAHASEKDALEATISDLNRQLSVKQAAATGPSSGSGSSGSSDLSQKTIYLTFDDGPSPRTPEILKILDKYGVKATFFVINGGKYNQYMKDIVNAGHAIALHSYTHSYSTIYASESAYFDDLQKISDVVYEQTGVRTKLIRFPGGSSNTVSRKYSSGIMTRLTKQVESKGYVYFDWNLSSGDADGNRVPAQTLINNCRKVPRSNSVIVLMHDASVKKTTVEALPSIIEYYKNAGCKFAKLTESSPTAHQRVNN